MLRIALRGVRSNPFRYAATSLAIIVGIAFFIATGVMTSSFRDSINSAISEVFEEIDVAVQSTDTVSQGPFDQVVRMPRATGDQLADVEGVADVEPYTFGWAQVVGSDGKIVPGSSSQSGFVWIDNEQLNPYYLVDGRAPSADDEIVLDVRTFDRGGFELGDDAWVLPLRRTDPTLTIVGTIDTDIAGAATEQTVAFTPEASARILRTTDADQFFIETVDGFDNETVVDNVQARIDGMASPLEAITGDDLAAEYQELIDTFTGFLNTALQVFAGVALFVGAFVIYNTFSIIVAQRTKEMALLRAIGASGRQVSRSVLVEAIIIGVIASLLGVLGGIGLAFLLLQLLTAVVGDFAISLALPAGTFAVGIAIGTILTVAAAWIPARRGAKIAPIEALRDAEVEEVRASATRRIAGIALITLGLFAALVGVGVIGDRNTWLLVAGLAAIVISIFLLAPILVRPVTGVLAIPLVRRGQITGELARENARRNPKRTATTSLTLMIGVALMVTAAVFAATLSHTVRSTLEERIDATDIVTVSPNAVAFGGGLDPAIADSIATIEGVDRVVPIRQVPAELQPTDRADAPSQSAFIVATSTDHLDAVLDIDMAERSFSDVGETGVAIADSVAESNGLQLGDRLTARYLNGEQQLEVAAVYEDTDTELLAGGFVIDAAGLDENAPGVLDAMLYVVADDSADEAIAAALADNPTASLRTTSEYITDQARQVNMFVYLLYGLLGMAVLVALIGIVNTMALSIHERTRELGLLRSVGMTQRQLKRAVRFESALVALMGTAVGIGLGLLMSWLAYEASSDFLESYQVPWVHLVVILIVGLVAGVLAGVLPARRAAKLDVLDAISHE